LSDPNHPESHRSDVVGLILTLVGLAGLTISVAGVAGGTGLWPSFSGERVYTAQALLSERDTPRVTEEVAPRVAEPVVVREAEKGARRSCDREQRAKQSEKFEAQRRQPARRARMLSRRLVSFLTPTV
jgi:hypothetical protein